jgi:hypothetical protein
MHARTHVWIAHEVTGSTDSLLLFGSLLPDMNIDGSFPRGFDMQAVELLRFLKREYPDLMKIGIGMCLHEYPIGVDRFVHTQYRGGAGYAFSFVRELIDDARVATPLHETQLPLLTHFLVEYAIEIKIVNEHPASTDLLTKTLGIKKERICEALAKFYRIPAYAVAHEIEIYSEAQLSFDFKDHENAAHGWLWFLNRVFHQTANPKDIAALIRKAELLIEPTVDIFLLDCVAQCKEDFRYNFPSFNG